MRNTLCVCVDYKRNINLYVDVPDKMITQIITYIHLFNGTILGEGEEGRGGWTNTINANLPSLRTQRKRLQRIPHNETARPRG